MTQTGKRIDRLKTRPGGRLFAVGAAVICFLFAAAVVHAAEPASNEWRLAVGPTAGGLTFDQSLANYHWDTRPSMQSGVEATLYHGSLGVGLRVLRSHTTQSNGIPGDSQASTVNLTSFDVVGQARVVRQWGAELWGAVQTGMLHLGYIPDQQTFDVGGNPVTVDFEPIFEWSLGLGLELRREIIPQMAASLQADVSTFALDAAHRSGNEIVLSRERFYSWSLRMQVSWFLNLS